MIKRMFSGLFVLLALALIYTLSNAESTFDLYNCNQTSGEIEDVINSAESLSKLGIPESYAAAAFLCWTDSNLQGYPTNQTCVHWSVYNLDWNATQYDDIVRVNIACVESSFVGPYQRDVNPPIWYTGSVWCSTTTSLGESMRTEIATSYELKHAHGLPLDSNEFTLALCAPDLKTVQSCAYRHHDETTIESFDPPVEWYYVWYACANHGAYLPVFFTQ